MTILGLVLGVFLCIVCWEQRSTAEPTILLPCTSQNQFTWSYNKRDVCIKEHEGQKLLSLVTNSKISPIIGSFPSELCDLVGLISTVSVIAWECPQKTNMEPKSNLFPLLPSLMTTADALTQAVIFFRFKSVSCIILDHHLWKELGMLMENKLLRRNVTVRHRVFLQSKNQSVMDIKEAIQQKKIFAKVIVLLLPASKIGTVISVLDSLDLIKLPLSCVFVVHFSVLKAVDIFYPLQRLDVLLFTLTTENSYFHLATDLSKLINSSLTIADDRSFAKHIVKGFLVTDWQQNDTNSSGIWRPLTYQPISSRNEIIPLVTGAQKWLTNRINGSYASNQTCYEEFCDEFEEGIFTNALSHCIVAVSTVILVVMLAILSSMIRRLYQKALMSKGPCKIILAPKDFVFPHVQEVKRVEEGIEAMLCCWLHQLQELGGPEVDKPDLLKGSLGSLKSNVMKSPSLDSVSKINSDPRARYNGDLVHLKPLPDNGGTFELRSKSMDYLVTMHSLRHENLNPLIGCLVDPARPFLVWEYCSRGSLEDVLMADEIKLDWSFRLSLLTDLVRGMKYLHSSSVKVHGNLTSRNCVIDARWVLKITDYALLSFFESQNISPSIKKPKDLLWCAPEFLRDRNLRKTGSQAGDVYSFSIIMQEVIVRGEPYCMLSLPPEEILEKIKHPPPLIRPSVSKGAAPPEAINIMRQCWAELPDMRPDFNTIHDLFKTLNQGRKANFVDTMFQMLEKYSNNLEDLIRERTEQLDMEKKKTEQLLNRMLPSYVAEKLKLGMPVDPEEYDEVTIYFSDIVGFTTISAYSTPFEVVDLLNDLYTCFDATINAYNVYKVETIGDAYMVAGGLPLRTADHAEQVATMALDLLHQSGKFRIRHLPFTPLRLRIGLHTGSAWRIHISESTKNKLEASGGYHIECRGLTELKGKGRIMTYWLLGKVGFDKELPTPPPIRESHGLDEQLVQFGRTGIYPAQLYKDESNATDSINTPAVSSSRTSKKKTLQPTYQLSLDAGLLAASLEDVKIDSHKWKMHKQKTFDASDDKTDYKLSADSKSGGENTRTTVSTSDISINLPGVSFVNQNRSTPNPNNKIKKIVDENDLSSQYNFYRSLSPNSGSESKAPSSRFLKRQFSMDKDDPTEVKNVRLFKQNSAGAANELGRIDEIPTQRITSPSFSKDTSYKLRNIQPASSSSESLNQNS
ncbi:uncharacterized protein isoform X3 [Rhodnius prolixus]|uniref:uncharacterized protein isoform X3 n=1 Tax=Rhodnius prolixus TaxID=13249 RepID=UPI003D18F1DD